MALLAALVIFTVIARYCFSLSWKQLAEFNTTLFAFTTFWGMGGGTVVSAAMSGIDIALWDIKGKALGLPVWQLMGGKTNDNLRTYASQLQFNWGSNLSKQRLIEPEEYAEVTRVAMAEGYDSIKVDPLIFSNQPDGKGPWKITGPLEHKVIKTVYDRIAAMRKAGVKLTIVSNGAEKRVRPFAEKLGLAYLYRSAKPLPFALGVARRRMQVKRREMAMVGDQLYADRMAAALYGIPGLMVIPRGPDLGAQVVLKRKWEKRHWQKYYDRGGKTL